jgi:hypothetical protein
MKNEEFQKRVEVPFCLDHVDHLDHLPQPVPPAVLWKPLLVTGGVDGGGGAER